jgi:hypothetical protein
MGRKVLFCRNQSYYNKTPVTTTTVQHNGALIRRFSVWDEVGKG